MADARPQVHRDLKLTDPLMHGADVRQLQQRVNEIGKTFDLKLRLDEDSQAGEHTFHAAARAAWIMGLPDKIVGQIHDGKGLSQASQGHLRQPDTRSHASQVRAVQRRKRRALREEAEEAAGRAGGNFVALDGHRVPRWMVEQALTPARNSGVWTGVVFSGFRTPEKSTRICMHACGAATCAGTCAGASSNHSAPPTHTGVPFEGAVDVTDPDGLQEWCAAHGFPIRHTLPNDLAHFSRTGA